MPQKKKSKLPVNPSTQDQLHYNAVLLEEIRSQMGGVIETVELTREDLNLKMQSMEERLTGKIEVVEMVVRSHSEKFIEHDKRFDQVDKRFEQVDKRFEQVDKRFEQVDKRFEQLEKNLKGEIRRVESKVDRIVDKVECHDEEIDRLKSAVFPA